jgi:hypothetical protein
MQVIAADADTAHSLLNLTCLCIRRGHTMFPRPRGLLSSPFVVFSMPLNVVICCRCPIIVNAIIHGGSIDMAAEAEAVAAAGSHHGRQLLLQDRQLLAAAASRARSSSSSSNSSSSFSEKGVAAVLLTAVPFVCAAICAVLLGHRSQRQREKAAHCAVPYFTAALLFIVFPFVASCGGAAAFVCLVLAITLLTAPNAILNSLASAVSQGPSAAVGLALYNAVSVP